MRRVGAWSWSLASVAMLALYVPLLAIAVASFNQARYGARWEGFTLRWYRALLGDADPQRAALAQAIRHATWDSAVLALLSAAIATALGTLLALAYDAAPWPRRLRAVLDTAVRLPLVVPDLLLAGALVVALAVLRRCSDLFAPGLAAMVVGHVSFQISAVCLVVHARLRQIGPTQLEAAHDLYAGRWRVLTRIVLPQLAPAMLAAAMLAATLSLDDFVISFFTASPRTPTLPMLIWSEVRRGVPPEMHALSSLIILVTAVLTVAATLLTRRRT